MSQAPHEIVVVLSGFEDWLRAHGQFTSGAAIALIAWALASWVQGRSKAWEFRAHAIREAAHAYQRLLIAAARVNYLVENPAPASVTQTHSTSNNVTVHVSSGKTMLDYWGDFHDAHFALIAVKTVVQLHFRRSDTKRRFQNVIARFADQLDIDLPQNEREKARDAAQDEWGKFLKCAGREVGLNPWWRRLWKWTRRTWRRIRKQPIESD